MKSFNFKCSILAMLLAISPIAANAQKGACGTDVKWELNGQTLTISGEGEMFNFDETNTPSYTPYKSKIRHIVFTDKVRSVGNNAFYFYEDLESVTLGDSIQRIGQKAFQLCKKLDRIDFPEHIKIIERHAFANCRKLSELTLPASLQEIQGGAFGQCTSIKKVYYNATNCEMGLFDEYGKECSVFAGCASSLQQVVFGPTVRSISDYAFQHLTNLNFTTANTIEHVGKEAFAGTWWLSQQKHGLIYVDKAAYLYYNPENIEPISIALREGTTSISEAAFKDCKLLVKVEVPRSLNRVNENSFEGCTALSEVVWNADSCMNASSNNGNTSVSPFSETMKVALYSIEFGPNVQVLPPAFLAHCTGLTEIKLPESLRVIGSETFYDCKGIKQLVIPNKVETIGRNTFSYMENLEYISFGENLQNYYMVNHELSHSKKLKKIEWNCIHLNPQKAYPNSGAYFDAPFTTLVFGDKVEFIPGVFGGNVELSEVKIGKAVKEIASAAFSDCKNIKHIELPDALEKLNIYAFDHTSVEHVFIPKNVTEMSHSVFRTETLKTLILANNHIHPSGILNEIYHDGAVAYVPDNENSKDEWYKDWDEHIKPMISTTTNDTTIYNGQAPDVKFDSNIPGYTLASISPAETTAEAGTHKATMKAKFEGERPFEVDVTWNYTILKASQEIVWEQDFTQFVEGQTIQLTPQATSKLPLTIELASSLYNSKLEKRDDGTYWLECGRPETIKIYVSQKGDKNWNPAQTLTQEITIQKSTGLDATTTPTLTAAVNNQWLTISGLTQGEELTVFDASGKVVYNSIATSNECRLKLSQAGVYLIRTPKQTIKCMAG